MSMFSLVPMVVASIVAKVVVSEKVHLLADPALLEYTAAELEITLGPVTKVGPSLCVSLLLAVLTLCVCRHRKILC